RFAARFGVLHTSSHIGDELIERTGRERIGYTREELLLGGRWAPATRWSLYAEAAYAHERRNQDLQRPWRWQTGAEYLAGDLWLRGRAGWYVALDLAVWEERDSRVDSTLQAGVSVRSGVQTWRLGIELHDGRPALGEFFQDTERYAAVGVWLEL
ncbi:MAG: DUF1207 domain-containing protein, partial [Thermoanaerobaculia bacterium]|nr:DUF1207 domain-containing protein [Thermoanaerobaculia bacterium]